jgi:hypothetical protein
MNEDIFPILAEDFLTKESNEYLLNWIKLNEDLHDDHRSTVEYWNKKCIYFDAIEDQTIKKFLYKICKGMLDFVSINSPNEQIYVERPQFVRWREGDELIPHADNIEQDGVTPNASPHRTYGGVLYLNGDFEGGQIYYPNLNIQVQPRPGMVVIHPAGLKYTHGVRKMQKGTRYTISTFFSSDQSYSIDNYYSLK